MPATIWCIDTSSLIVVRSLFSRTQQSTIARGLSALVEAGRLRFPREVLAELERYEGRDNPALRWARANADRATGIQPSFADVAAVLEKVPEVVDPDKEGVEEADPYVLALARGLALAGEDSRVVTEEFKTNVAKMPLGSAAGYLRIPSVSLRTMLKFEDILPYTTPGS